jgi:hypothetical protein
MQLVAQINIKAEDIGLPKVQANDQTIGNVISGALVVVGAVSLLYLMIGAFRYVIAGGGGKKGADVAKAKDTILYAIIGMVISMLAFTIVQFVLGRLF